MSSFYKKRRKRKITLYISILFFLLGVVFLIIYSFKSYTPGNITLQAPFAMGQYEFNKNELSQKELDIAWKLYIQLKTRKAAIPVDPDKDIIVEVYDSWYELFKTTRDYLLELSTKDLQNNDDAIKTVDLSLGVLNSGLRPHLTEWQGKYRKWYEEELEKPENKGLAPQEIQKKYPHYKELKEDMLKVNKGLIAYAEELKKFSNEEPLNAPSKLIYWFKNIGKKSNENKNSVLTNK